MKCLACGRVDNDRVGWGIDMRQKVRIGNRVFSRYELCNRCNSPLMYMSNVGVVVYHPLRVPKRILYKWQLK